MKAILLVAFVLAAQLAQAQQPQQPPQAQQPQPFGSERCYQPAIDKVKQAQKDRDQAALSVAVDELVEINRNVACFTQFAVQREAVKSIIGAFEGSRTDKQAGASAGGTGTTSLVSRGAAAKVMSFAVENGALTQSVKGTVVTVKGNLAGVPSALIKRDLLPYCDPRFGDTGSCITSDTIRFLQRISFGVAFDMSRDSASVTGAGTEISPAKSGATPAVFTASGREVSQIAGRVEIVNKRDAASKEYQTKWKQQVVKDDGLKAAANTLLKEMNQTIGPLIKRPTYAAWRRHATERVRTAQGDLEQVWANLLSELVRSLRAEDDSFNERLVRLRSAFQTFDFVEDQFIDELSTSPVVTFEYVNNRPASQPTVSIYRVIGEVGWKSANSVAFNVAFGLYDKEQPDANGQPTGRWRDFELGVQYERKLGTLDIIGPAAVDIAGYFQDQRSPAILDVNPNQPLPGITFVGLPEGAKKVFAQKGKIGVAQVRLVLGPEKTSVRIPFAVSWSNRTELIDKPAWRAQVGIAYDFDALFAK